MRRLAAGAVVLTLLAGCFGPDPNLSEGGKGLPVLSVDFPPTVEAGSTAMATLSVENPGPGDMSSVVVAFASVGVAAASGPLPAELVPLGAGRDDSAIESVRPAPRSVSDDGVIYVFDGLREGESLEVTFSIRVPDDPGPAANSGSVYAGDESDRIRGLRLETEVRG